MYDDDARKRTRLRRAALTAVVPLAAAALLAGGRAVTGAVSGGPPEAGRAPGGRGDGAPAPTGAPAPSGTSVSAPLAGRVVVIDPGHNPGNFRHPSEIAEEVDIGTNRKECDTTGTSTQDGYTEASFTLDVSHRLRTILRRLGATVELTHDAGRPYGPCIDQRARIGNEANGGRGADAVVSVHADGSASGGRGHHVIVPGLVKAGAADTAAIVAPSRRLGEHVAAEFARATGSAPADYLGGGTGLVVRKDLGGLNLSTVPKVFVECGNMRDPRDAALLSNAAWRQKAAQGIANGVGTYLLG
ncbi:N-acetylmuramoyl-L-alanine amidase family protein [Streptomyces somaliensis]|uniref:N-acetylmuramoyl-L-alanine amidase n=1 Tax=Streptomyces somaliensis (strain ATCC 33201 / DSM 40738 / JCM 12659 / KCTC 9044 / NCTC 11332 / NRRL B-12077 / IP 733) TaxID=1134445 RepID=A0AA44IDK6_STRE0|nr:N-acetylmuramoyl-L-alanine amidase [Streptomyces somaliensis]NKY14721.1 N-acetylmuramoyl-L-alanine amidase [Streptomyces somaliensis DSM 40738]